MDKEEAECIAAEVIADFPNDFIETELIIIDNTQVILNYGKECVYQIKKIKHCKFTMMSRIYNVSYKLTRNLDRISLYAPTE